MLKIFQARFQQYMNQELADVQDGFRKGRETRDQIANIRWIIEKAREFHKNINFCFIDFTKTFDWFDLLAVQGTLKSSPAAQFKSISSSVLSLLCGSTLTSIHYY